MRINNYIKDPWESIVPHVPNNAHVWENTSHAIWSLVVPGFCPNDQMLLLPSRNTTSRLYPWQWAATKDGNRNLNQAHRCNRTGLGSVVNKIRQASTGQLSNSPPSQQKENAMISEVKDYMSIFSEELLTAKIYGCRNKLPEWSQKLLFTPQLSMNKECIESILRLKKDKLLEIY